jgi:hypothetical protein
VGFFGARYKKKKILLNSKKNKNMKELNIP